MTLFYRCAKITHIIFLFLDETKKGVSIIKEQVKIHSHEVPKCEHFHYLGSIIIKDGHIPDDATHRIEVSWLN